MKPPKPTRGYKTMVRAVVRQVSWFNGWSASEDSVRESAERAVNDILKIMARRKGRKQ